jgi:hypothetical protein
MQTNNKNVIITIAAILVLGFFMPWFHMYAGLSAWDMLFGDAGRIIDVGFKYLALLIPISGGIIIYGAAFNNESYPVSKNILFRIPILTLIVITIIIGNKLSDLGARGSDIEYVYKIIGIGFWMTLIASLILPFRLKQSKPKIVNQDNHDTPVATPNENQIASQPVNQQNFTRPQVNINLPKFNMDESIAKWKATLVKHKVLVLSSCMLLICFVIVYNLFIKADPVKDGKDLAKSYCDCTDELYKNNSTTMESFINDFDSKKFKMRIEARNLLNKLLQDNQSKYISCTQKVNLKYIERLADYNAKADQNASIFQQTYAMINNACNNSSNNDIVNLQSEIETKIKSISDPEPDIEKIKADLIGQSIPGWKFSYISEIKSGTISNVNRMTDRIEYQVDLHMVGYNNTNDNYNDAQIIVTYTQNDAWYFNNVKEIFITYQYTVPSENWVTIFPIQNCRWNCGDDQKTVWKTFDWGTEIMSGPDAANATLPNSNSYMVKSREGHPVSLKLTYKPNT